jgi:hypothetical protein
MDIIELNFPQKEYEKDSIDFISEFNKFESKINGSGGLDSFIDNL